MRKTHLDMNTASVVFDMFPPSEQANWKSTAATPALDSLKDIQIKQEAVGYRKTSVGKTGPFGTREVDAPIDAHELLAQLTN